MGGNVMGLSRSLFGYRRKVVIKLIEDRDRILREAESRVRAAEAKVGELESELVDLKAQNSRLDQQLELLRLQMASIAEAETPSVEEEVVSVPSEAPVETPIAPARETVTSFVVEELTRIMSAAQEGAARIIDRAAASAREQIARSTEVRQGIQAEVSRLATWRHAMEPAVGNVRSRLDGIRVQIEEIPERIKQALAPLADALSSIDESLNELSSLCAALAPIAQDVSTAGREGDGTTSPAAPPTEKGTGDGEADVTVVPDSSTVQLDQGSEEQLETAWHAAGWMRATVGF
jgi:chromosome segregation ATPase